jgi:hypothetical protein
LSLVSVINTFSTLQIKDCGSNTNYTMRIEGTVTFKGTRYKQQTLHRQPFQSTYYKPQQDFTKLTNHQGGNLKQKQELIARTMSLNTMR